MKNMLLRIVALLSLGTALPTATLAVTRTLTATLPSTPVHAGDPVTIPVTASTDAGGGEQVGFLHIDYSLDGGATWTGFAYDQNLGSSATRNVSVTAGAAGTTIVVRARAAFRFGAAGDVDYTGAAINWSGSWNNWQTPPTIYASVTVAPRRVLAITAPASVPSGQAVSIPISASTDGPGGEQIGFLHIEYSIDGGSSWSALAYDQNLGTSATRTLNLTAGVAGTTIVVRARAAYRFGSAGDVDYAGAAINWSGSWSNWQTPPTRYASIPVTSGPVLLYTAGSAGTYHVSGQIAKDGNPSDPQDFGDGVVFEVFKRSGSTDTVLWSSLLARRNPNDPAKVNLTTSLAANDSVYYRLVSHTSDTTYDSVTFPASFVVKSANIGNFSTGLSPSTSITDNKTDDIQAALTNAINAMSGSSPAYDRAEVVLPAGTYYLYESGSINGEALLSLASTKNVTLRGPGAKLVIAEPTPRMFINVSGSTNVEIGDLELDYVDSCLPFIQGTVAASPAPTATSATINLTWTPQTTSTVNSTPRFASDLFCHTFDPTTGLLKGSFEISGCNLSGSTATLTLTSGTLVAGDRVVLAIRGNTNRLQEAALRFSGSTDCLLRDVTLRAGGWISLIGRDLNGLHFQRFKVARANGTNRYISTNGDGMQLKDSRRGPTVLESTFEGMLDDGINLHATIQNVTAIANSTTFTVDGSAASAIRVGDVLQVFRRDTPNNGNAVGYEIHHRVTNVSGNTITVATAIESNANKCVNLSASGEGFLIRDSVFTRFRNRGALLQTGYGWIDQNDFIETSGLALSFEANLGLNGSVEGPYPHHTKVSGNHFERTGYGYNPNGNPAIQIWGHNLVNPPAPMFRALSGQITGNTFVQQTSSPVSVVTGPNDFVPGANTIQ